MHTPHHIYGIDFSDAQDAGKKIWIVEGPELSSYKGLKRDFKSIILLVQILITLTSKIWLGGNSS